MRRHDEALLWEYAARELQSEEAALLEHHLDECPDCKEKLLEVRTAHQLLADAKVARPRLDWEKVDGAIEKVVERRLAAKARTSRLQWVGLAAAVAGVAIALGGWFLWPRPAAVTAAPAVAQLPEPELHPASSHVEEAIALTRVGAHDELAKQGDLLAPGDVLRTAPGGRGYFHLADQSRVRLSGQSELTLMHASADEVALGLERGKVAVQASHLKRKAFVVLAGGLEVHVVGTVFEVQHTGRLVEVAVAEGRVEVTPPRGEALSVSAGERVRFDDTTWKPQQGRLTAGEKKDLAELVAADEREEQPAQQAVPYVVPSAVVASAGGPLPRLAKNDPRTQRHDVQLPAPAADGAPGETQVTVEAPERPGEPIAGAQAHPMVADAAPAPVPGPRPTATVSQAPVLIVPAAPPPETAPAPQPADDPAAEWGTMPATPPPAAEPAPASAAEPAPAPAPEAAATKPAPRVETGELAIDRESIFLRKAARSLDGGRCEGFLLGLQEIAGDKDSGDRAERARILRARCFDHRLEVRQAEQEYRKYLRDFPGGTFAPEARRFLEQ